MKNKGLTIVFTPALASIYDQVFYLNLLGIRAVTINSETGYTVRDEIKAEIEQENSAVRFLIITPEIFSADFGNKGNAVWFKGLIANKPINYIVVDEAHKVIDASEFREAFNQLREFRSMNLNIPWIALTTVNRNLEGQIAEYLNIQDPFAIWSSSVRKNIFYDTVPNATLQNENIVNFLKRMQENEKIPPGIIFCNTYAHLEATESYLRAQGFTVGCYYGNMPQGQRNLERWFNREFSIIIATSESFGFGIHYRVPPIKFVIHLGMPEKLRSFYHVRFIDFF
jgi:superfamily II DNA helicase RecQ